VLKVEQLDSLGKSTALQSSTLAPHARQVKNIPAMLWCTDGAKAAFKVTCGAHYTVLASVVVRALTAACHGVLMSCLQQELQV
jgi:hypothetical protein